MPRVKKEINWDDAQYREARDAVCAMKGYQEEIIDPENPKKTIKNPQSKAGFFNEQVKEWAFNQALEYANRQALQGVTKLKETEKDM